MYQINTNFKKIRLTDILGVSLKDSINLKDVCIYINQIDSKVNFLQQRNASFLFEVDLDVDIDKVVEKKILGYQFSVKSSTGKVLVGPVDVSFYDDFPDSIQTGEKDFEKIKSLIKKPKTLVVDTGALNGGLLNPYIFSNKTTKPDSLVLDKTSASYKGSAIHVYSLGMDPDNLAQSSLPPIETPSSAHNFSKEIKSNIVVKNLLPGKSSAYLRPTLGEKLSLVTDRQEKMKILFPPIASEVAQVHEFAAIENDNYGKEIDAGNVIKVVNPYFKSNRTFEIPSSCFFESGRVHFVFSPIIFDFNGDIEEYRKFNLGKKKEPETVVFDGKKEGFELLDPKVEPTVQILVDKPGLITYRVHRNDMTTNEVLVTLSYVNTVTGKITQVEKQKHTFDDIEERSSYGSFNQVINTEPYLSRLTAKVISPKNVSLSTNTLGKSHPSNYYAGNAQHDLRIFCSNTQEGITVDLEFDPTNVSKIDVYKEKLFLPNTSANKTTRVYTEKNPSGEITFLDQDVLSSKTYRYYASMTRKVLNSKGMPTKAPVEIFGKQDAVVTRHNLLDKGNLYDLSVTKLISKTGNAFQVDLDPRTSEIDLLLKGLKGAGLEKYFGEDIAAQKDYLEKLNYIVIERIDRSTGDKEYIDTIEPNTSFNDKNVSKLSRYTYVFTLSVIDPKSAVDLLKISGENSENMSDKDIEKATKRILENYTRFTGVLPASSDSKALSSKGMIQGSMTSLSTSYTTEVTGQLEAPVIISSNEIKNAIGKSKDFQISFSMRSNILSSIDCFYVYCNYQGSETVIKTISCDEDTNVYYVTDNVYFDELGTKQYYIRAKYNDNQLGPSSTVITKKKNASISSTLLGKTSVLTVDKSPEKSSSVPIKGIFKNNLPEKEFF